MQRAVTIDPTYALAHAGIADTYNSLGWDLFAGLAPSEAFPNARRSAQKALMMDPQCAEAYAALGWTPTSYDWEWITAEKAYQRAIEIKPQYGPVHIWYSHLLHALDRSAESLEESHLAIECDPLGLILNVHLGWHHVYDRECEKAIEHLRKTIELEPAFTLARLFLGEAYEQLKRFEEAVAEFETAVTRSARHPVYLAALGHAHAAAGHKQEALNIIDELHRRSRDTFIPARGIAEIYIGMDEKEHAFIWLEKALRERNGWLIHTGSNPRYDRLRSDPRYNDLIRSIGLI